MRASTSRLRFNPPPNWPPPPRPDWTPGPRWRPDPAWGPPPVGWPLWLPRGGGGDWTARHRITSGLAAAVVGVLLCGVVLGTGGASPPAAARPVGSGVHPTPAAPPTPAARQPRVARLGEPARDGRFEFVVRRIARQATIGEGLLADRAHGRYVVLYVDVRNVGATAQTFDSSPQRLYDVAGREFQPSFALFRLPDAGRSFLERINPGNRVSGAPLVFDLPVDAKLDRVELHDSLFSGGVSVSLRRR